jgi:large subunit ribosomal protein L22
MKTQKVQLKYLKMTPRKVRLIANLIKGLSVNDAQAQLLLNPRRASEPILKLLQSAVNSATNNKKMALENLFIKEIRVDQGPTLKRWLPRAMGRATPIHKKSSHLILVLAESEKPKISRFKIQKQEKIKKPTTKKNKAKDEKEKTERFKKENKSTEGHGFKQRMFRRKSV